MCSTDILEHLLIPFPTCCFYKLVLEGCPCKAYFDFEANRFLLTSDH